MCRKEAQGLRADKRLRDVDLDDWNAKRSASNSGRHWPAAGADLGVDGVSYVELLTLYELLWAGERLVLEKAVSLLSQVRASNFSVGCSVWSRH